MRKYFIFSGLIVIGIFTIILIYLSYFGIKTNNFNKFIENNARSYDSRITLKLNDVFLKLSLQEFSLKINTKNSKIGIDKNFIDLKNIDINLNLLKFFKNQNSIEKIQIITDENKIKNVTDFFNSYKFNISRSFAYNQISGGSIIATANFYFDKKIEDSFSYEVKGNIKNANVNLVALGKLKKINFNFDIKDKKYIFDNIKFKYQDINYQSKKITIIESGKDFEIKGILNSEKGLINPKSLSNIFNLNLDILEEKEILAETESNFAFKIKSNRSIKDFEFKSNLKFDEIFINKKYQDLIYFKDVSIETKYINKNLSIDLTSGFYFFEDKNKKKTKNDKDENILKLNIVKKNKENFKIEGNLKHDETFIDPKALSEILKINLEVLSSEDILIKSNNKFSFQIDKKQKIQDLSINSILNFDKINFNKKFQRLINLENGVINAFIRDKSFDFKIDSNFSLIDNKYKNKVENQNIKFAIKNNKKNSIDVETIIQTNRLKIYSQDVKKYLNLNNILIKDEDIELDSNNKINFSVDKKNNINDLKVKSFLKFDKLTIDYKSNKLKKFVLNYDDKIHLKGNNIEINYTKEKTEIKGEGKYSLNDKFENYNVKINNIKNKYNFDGFFDLINIPIQIDKIGYQKTNNNNLSTINLIGFYNKNNKNLFLSEANFIDGKNKFEISNLNIELNKYLKVKNIDKLRLNYLNSKKKLNDITFIKKNNNYELTGTNYDGRSLVNNIIDGNSNNNFFNIFENLNSDIKININQLYLGDQSYLENILGNIIVKKNKIYTSKINAFLNKNNKFSYSLKSTPDNVKITKLYIENPEPFIKNYKFIKGFKEGTLEFNSTKIGKISKSNLKIYDFKVQKVPVLAKILTLASLQGIADILTGEGIRFNQFDMDYIKNGENTSIKEMYAIGPAISIIMEGYLVKDKLTSLKGTLVPATTINKSIKKIPLIGNILVGKKVGEGVFGVSFKIKGPPKDLKTTVNPVKTLTPRFITRTLEKLK